MNLYSAYFVPNYMDPTGMSKEAHPECPVCCYQGDGKYHTIYLGRCEDRIGQDGFRMTYYKDGKCPSSGGDGGPVDDPIPPPPPPQSKICESGTWDVSGNIGFGISAWVIGGGVATSSGTVTCTSDPTLTSSYNVTMSLYGVGWGFAATAPVNGLNGFVSGQVATAWTADELWGNYGGNFTFGNGTFPVPVLRRFGVNAGIQAGTILLSDADRVNWTLAFLSGGVGAGVQGGPVDGGVASPVSGGSFLIYYAPITP